MNVQLSCIRNNCAKMSRALPLVLLFCSTAAQAESAPAPSRDFASAGACSGTTEDALRSCRQEAESDYWLASGKCLNLSNPARQTSCQKHASADLQDARQTCDDQQEAREAVCAALGEAPYDPVINPARFVGKIDNPYFPLTPGTTLVYEGVTDDGLERDEFAVTHNTRVILGVTCVEVHDIGTLDSELVEDTLDWFAQDKDGNVWYFGENSRQIEGGLVVGVNGSWTAGEDGAKPGIIMKAHPTAGDLYRQEFSLGVAEDMGQVLSLNATAAVPAGSFDHCLQTKDFSPLEPDALEQKFYAPGVGSVLEIDKNTGERLELVRIEK
jgi:hypothetical protein